MHYSEFRQESQITAIGWGWVGSSVVKHEVLNQDLSNEREMLARFLEDYAACDVIAGHYITRHDLPLLVDHCMRFGWSLPEPKLAQDTKTLMPRVRSLGLSQDNLAALFELDEKKQQMVGRRWAVANTLSPEGRELAAKRVAGDVRQHKALRAKLAECGYLKPPRIWRP
jgi:hypothetical protein